MKKNCVRIVSALVCIALVAVGSLITATADRIPLPEYTVPANAFAKIESVSKGGNEILISTKVASKAVTLSLTFAEKGGMHIKDKNAVRNTGVDDFSTATASVSSFSNTSKIATAVCENGTKAVINYTADVWTVSFFDKSGECKYVLNASDMTANYSGSNRTSVGLSHTLSSNEYFLGLGERYSGVLLNGNVYEMFNRDCWSGLTYENDSYVNVPFIHSNKGYSIFYNTYYAGKVDVAKTDSSKLSFDFYGGDIDFYIFVNTPLENIKSYTAITGTPVSAPYWALGYTAGATAGYWNESANTKVTAMLAAYGELGTMPYAIYGEGDASTSEEIIKYAKQNGVNMYGWNNPNGKYFSYDGLSTCWATYAVQDAIKQYPPTVNVNGNKSNVEENWPVIRDKAGHVIRVFADGYDGETVTTVTSPFLLDYSHPWVSSLIKMKFKRAGTETGYDFFDYGLKGLMVDYGDIIPIDGYYSDSTAPNKMAYTDNTVFYNGMTGEEMHNYQGYVYPKVMRAVWDEMTASYPQNYSDGYLFFARAGSAGTQKYAATFGGDQRSSFDGLKKAVMGGISISASGYSIWGSDIGGLMESKNGDLTTELYKRWLEFATFSPLMRAHGDMVRNSATVAHDPWNFTEKNTSLLSTTDLFKKYYYLRENLMDVIYSADLLSEKDGTPIMQAMALAFPEQSELFTAVDQYMFCNEILVAPVYTSGATTRTLTLPNGSWYDLYSGEKAANSGSITVSANADKIPAYLRSGTVLPVSVSKSTLKLATEFNSGNKASALAVTPAETNRALTWYSDNGETKYYNLKTENGYKVKAESENNPEYILAYGTAPKAVFVDGKRLQKLSACAPSLTGYYVADGVTYINLGTEVWNEIEFDNGALPTFCDYTLNVTAKQSVEPLDSDFEVYTFSYINGASDKAVSGPFKPSDKASNNNTYWVCRAAGNNVNNYMRAGSVDTDQMLALTYKNKAFTDFTAEYEMFTTYGILGMTFGAERGVYPFTRNNIRDDRGVMVYVEREGRINIGGAIDPSTIQIGENCEKGWTQNNFSSLDYVRVDLGLDSSERPPVSNSDTADTYTVHVEAKDGVLTVYLKGYENRYVKVDLRKTYIGGYVSLISNNMLQGAFKKFTVTGNGYTDRDISNYDFTNLSSAADLNGSFTAYFCESDTSAGISGNVSDIWTLKNKSVTAGFDNNYLKPSNSSNSKYSVLTPKDATFTDNFIATAEYCVNYSRYGIMISPDNTYPTYTSRNAIRVDTDGGGFLRISGAIDPSTAKWNSTLVDPKAESADCGGITLNSNKFADYVTASMDKSKTYTLCVSLTGGILKAWLKEYNNFIFSVKVGSNFSGGKVSLFAESGTQGAFKNFTYIDLADKETLPTVMREQKNGNELKVTLYSPAGVDSLIGKLIYGKSDYTFKGYTLANGVSGTLTDTNGEISFNLKGKSAVKLVTVTFTTEKDSAGLKVHLKSDNLCTTAKKAVLVSGDSNLDNTFDIRDLVRVEKGMADAFAVQRTSSATVYPSKLSFSSENYNFMRKILLF